jgi:hypothetical protein
MSEPMFLTLNAVIVRYRGQISEGTWRNWRSMRVGPSFLESRPSHSLPPRGTRSVGPPKPHRLPALQTTADK